jgi:hypothetical protein
MSASIFISFASQDLKVATTLCEALETRGFSCWISARDIEPGDNFQSAIVNAIQNAKAMLLVFSAHSNTSNEMTKELALASQQKLIVVPLRIEDVAPNAAFAYEFATRQWIDLFIDWEKAINQLCARLARALPPDASAAQAAATPALGAAEAATPTPASPPLRGRSSPLPLVLGIGAAVVLIVGALVALPMLRAKPAANAPATATVASAPAPSAPAPAALAPKPAAPAAPVQAASAPVRTASAAASTAAAAKPHHRREAETEAPAQPAKLAVDTRSDAYVCAHGDASDLRTVHACDRLDWSGTQAETH